MKRYVHKYRTKYKNIIGITLGIIGFIILVSVMPIEFLLSLIGIALLIMGFLIIKIK
jgi:hypothetical protein